MPGRHVLTPREAEEMAAHHMRRLGHPDAHANPGRGADGGLDVTARHALAQVKFRGGRAGRPDLQRLYGARADRSDLELWFFTGPGYSEEAVEYADRHAMVLFTFDLAGSVAPANQAAADVLAASAGERDAGPVAAVLASTRADDHVATGPRPRRTAGRADGAGRDDAGDRSEPWWDGPQHPAPEPEYAGWHWVSPGRALRRNVLLVVGLLAAAAAWLVGSYRDRLHAVVDDVADLTGRTVDVGELFVWCSGIALGAVVLYVVQVAVMFRLGKHPLKVPVRARRRGRTRRRQAALR